MNGLAGSGRGRGGGGGEQRPINYSARGVIMSGCGGSGGAGGGWGVMVNNKPSALRDVRRPRPRGLEQQADIRRRQ